MVPFVTLEGGGQEGEEDDSLDQALGEHVARKIGKLARLKRFVYQTTCRRRAPARSCARVLRDIAECRELGDVTTLRDPAVTEWLQERMQGDGEE
jgi:acetyl-CoA synthetase